LPSLFLPFLSPPDPLAKLLVVVFGPYKSSSLIPTFLPTPPIISSSYSYQSLPLLPSYPLSLHETPNTSIIWQLQPQKQHLWLTPVAEIAHPHSAPFLTVVAERAILAPQPTTILIPPTFPRPHSSPMSTQPAEGDLATWRTIPTRE